VAIGDPFPGPKNLMFNTQLLIVGLPIAPAVAAAVDLLLQAQRRGFFSLVMLARAINSLYMRYRIRSAGPASYTKYVDNFWLWEVLKMPGY